MRMLLPIAFLPVLAAFARNPEPFTSGGDTMQGLPENRLEPWLREEKLPQHAVLRLGTLRYRHPGIQQVCFSPDGRTLAAAGENGVTLFEAASGRITDAFDARDGAFSVDFDPDGRRLAYGHADHSIRVVNLRDQSAHVLKGAGNVATSLRFVQGGRRLISASGPEGSVRLWDVLSGKLLYELKEPDAEPLDPDTRRHFEAAGIDPDWGNPLEESESLAVSSDGGRTAMIKNAFGLWKSTDGEKLTRVYKEQHAGQAVAFVPVGDRIVSGHYDGTIVLRNGHSGKPEQLLLGHTKEVTCLAVAPDGKTLYSGSEDGTIRAWDLATCRQSHCVTARGGYIRALAVSPDGRQLASAVRDGLIRISKLPLDPLLHLLPPEQGPVLSADFSSDGASIASGSWDGMVRIWDAQTGSLSRMLVVGTPDRIVKCAFIPRSDRMACVDDQGRVQLWSLKSGARIAYWENRHEVPVYDLAVSPDGGLLATTDDKAINIWGLADAKEIAFACELTADNASEFCTVAFSQDGKRLAAGEPALSR